MRLRGATPDGGTRGGRRPFSQIVMKPFAAMRGPQTRGYPRVPVNHILTRHDSTLPRILALPGANQSNGFASAARCVTIARKPTSRHEEHGVGRESSGNTVCSPNPRSSYG
jgi:hypothetical protein